MAEDRCACGCTQERHRMGRGPCKDCPRFDCESFEPLSDVALPPEWSGPGLIIEYVETPAIRQFAEAMGPIPVATEAEIAAHLAAGNDIVKFTRPPAGPAPLVSEEPGSALPPVMNTLAGVLADLDVLELFEAWRCAVCGSRSWRRDRCNVLPECNHRWMEPVTVEIRRREVGGG